MKAALNADDSDDDGDDCGVTFGQLHGRTGNPQVPQDSTSDGHKHIESHPARIPLASTPLLLKSRIHAGGAAVVHELARGVPGFWGPPAPVVAELYVALEVQS